MNIYKNIKSNDPTRPVFLNLGQGVAWDGWHGRGTRTNHPEDYPKYIKGTDIVSFDIYPVVSKYRDVSGKLWMVAKGVKRLREWSGGRKIVWNVIECTRISNDNLKATPHQVRNEVWSSIINGSMGIIYFVHEWKPRFREAALLSDPEMLESVTGINRQIMRLAPVLNSPDKKIGVLVNTTNNTVSIDYMVKKYGGYIYIFAAGMRNGRTKAGFKVSGVKSNDRVEVIGEGRLLKSGNGFFVDNFGPWDVHIYRVKSK